MDNPFLNGPKQAIHAWRNFRAQLTNDKSDFDHLQMVSDFWAKAPLVTPYLDWDGPDRWPDPWELVSERKFDPSSVALGMEYTLLLSEDGRWSNGRLQLLLSESTDRTRQHLILLVDDRHVLNYYYNLVSDIDHVSKDFVIQQRYAYINKKHHVINGNLSGQHRE